MGIRNAEEGVTDGCIVFLGFAESDHEVLR